MLTSQLTTSRTVLKRKKLLVRSRYSKNIHTYILAHNPLGLFSGRLHQVPSLSIILNYLGGRVEGLARAPQTAAIRPIPKLPTLINYLYLQFSLIIFLTVNPNHPVIFPCGRKPENPEKTHDFRQNVNKLFPRAIRCSIQRSNR